MYTKSIIQQIVEKNKFKEYFKDELTSFMDECIIDDSIMTMVNSQLMEVTKGYFVVESEYDNVDEAIANLDLQSQAIRVIKNDKFQIGEVSRQLSNCPRDKKIFNIDQLEYTC